MSVTYDTNIFCNNVYYQNLSSSIAAISIRNNLLCFDFTPGLQHIEVGLCLILMPYSMVAFLGEGGRIRRKKTFFQTFYI